MKKFILITLTTLITNNLVAKEFFLGGSYNFNDKLDNKKDIKLRAEWFPKISFSNSFNFGIGLSHNFKNVFEQKKEVTGRTPVYAVLKSEMNTNSERKIYGKYRIGWNFEAKKGLYTGLEFGIEKNNFSFGITYDMENLESRNKAKHLKNNSIGISIGYVFKTKYDKDIMNREKVNTQMLEDNKVKTRKNYREWFGFYEDIK